MAILPALTGLRGPLPFDRQPAARSLFPVIRDPLGGRRRALGIVPRAPRHIVAVPTPVAEFPEGMGRGAGGGISARLGGGGCGAASTGVRASSEAASAAS